MVQSQKRTKRLLLVCWCECQQIPWHKVLSWQQVWVQSRQGGIAEGEEEGEEVTVSLLV
jgi:hypothetical protein